jgi:tRNA (mo5U34)-methyltransferase
VFKLYVVGGNKMIDYSLFYRQLESVVSKECFDQIVKRVEHNLFVTKNGHRQQWMEVLKALPECDASVLDFNQSSIQIGKLVDIAEPEQQKIEHGLRQFKPWRKGPFNLFGIDINSEWRGDLKWDRLIRHIHPLKDKTVLDVGCGNGYHCWRMLGEGARLVVGIDPTLLYVFQFQVMQKYLKNQTVGVLPLALEDWPVYKPTFDTIFSMGVLYHRRSPIDHLVHLKSLLKPSGGELVLESLIVEGDCGVVLTPEKRYAQMSNVWMIPSVETLMLWMRRVGFINIRCVDVSVTTATEQRSTAWSSEASLMNFLDPKDQRLTIEGYPAPCRAILIANTK